MRTCSRTCLLALALALLATLPTLGADAALICTAPLETVIAHSTHVVLAEWIADSRRFHPKQWLRGAWPEGELEVHGVPGSVRGPLASLGKPGFDPSRRVGRERVRISSRVLLFLEACDGRLYLTGYRRTGHGFGAHASIRLFTKKGMPLRLEQIMNPGGPAPSPAEAGTEQDLLALVRTLLGRHPYVPPPADRPTIPPEHAPAFYEALGDVVDWYQGGWHSELAGWGGAVADRETTLATADRIEAWMDAVPGDVRIHGLDALMLMGRIVQGRGVPVPEVIDRVRARVAEVGPGIVEAWILREVEYGGYYANREAFGRLARDLGPVPYERVLRLLEAWVERTEVNTGTACWWALVDLGHRDRAEAAAARREAPGQGAAEDAR